MRQYWLLLFGLCAPHVLAAANDAAGLAGTERQVGTIDNRQADQHPIAITDVASTTEPKCAVCEAFSELVRTPFQDPFHAEFQIQPNSPEAECLVHDDVRQAPEEGHLLDHAGNLEQVLMGKAPNDPRIGIYFGSVGKGTTFELLDKPDRGSHPHRAKLVDPEWIDVDILKGWVGSCAGTHGETCESSPFAAGYDLQRPTYLIDAVEGRLVDTSTIPDKTLQYVTLSHASDTHGNQSYLTTTTENVAQLQEPEALLSPVFSAHMPPTFRDAIELVRLLEYRYIWIPLLCVIQDDPASRAAETNKVADILVGGVFSIALLHNATQGIRGFKDLTNPQPRNMAQQLVPWGDETLVVPRSHYVCNQQVGEKTRVKLQFARPAWTLQEHLLPRRQLRFNAGSVEWRCRSCVSWEETAGFCDRNLSRLRSRGSVLRDPFATEGVLGPDTHRAHWSDALSLPWFSMNHYFQALRQLTELDASAGGEALDDAAGLMSRLAARSQGGILCGMPEARLDIALLFAVGGGEGLRGPRRRDVGPPSGPDLPWPSWSWAGWAGPVLVDPRMKGSDHLEPESEVDIIPMVEWYASDSPGPDATRRRLETRSYDDAKQRFQHSNAEPVPAGWTRQHSGWWSNYTQSPSRNQGRPDFDMTVTYTHESSATLQFSYPVPMQTPTDESATSISGARITTERFLSGMVERVFVHIRSSDHKPYYLNQPYKIYGQDGQHVGVLQSTGANDLTRLLGLPDFGPSIFDSQPKPTEVPRDTTARVEVVALSRVYTGWDSDLPEFMRDGTTRYSTGDFYEYYNVMWIEWTDGVACRKGLGRVLVDLWGGLQPERIGLVLG